MPTLNDALTTDGAIIHVLIGVGLSQVRSLHRALRPVLPPLSSTALLDTGAEMTAIDPSLVQALMLPGKGAHPANLPAHGGWMPAMIYQAGLTILHPSGNPSDNLGFPDIAVLELPLAAIGYQAIIGRDVLALCDFLYSGRTNSFQLTY